MKRRILWIITAIAIMTIFVIGAGYEQTTGSLIVAGICCAWLGLVAFATEWSKRHGR